MALLKEEWRLLFLGRQEEARKRTVRRASDDAVRESSVVTRLTASKRTRKKDKEEKGQGREDARLLVLDRSWRDGAPGPVLRWQVRREVPLLHSGHQRR